MARTQSLFESQLLLVKEKFADKYYAIAAKRIKGVNSVEPFGVETNMINVLDDNEVSKFLTLFQRDMILDYLITL